MIVKPLCRSEIVSVTISKIVGSKIFTWLPTHKVVLKLLCGSEIGVRQ